MASSVLLLTLVEAPSVEGQVPWTYCEAIVPTADFGALTLQQPPVSTRGVQRLLYLRVRFPSDVSDPVSHADATADLTAANQILTRASFGAFGLNATVSPVVHLTRDRTEYEGPSGFDRFIDDARAAGADAGFDYRDYDLEIVRHSGVSSFAGGNARLGQRGAQVQVGGPIILVHELGHNLGLSHANAWSTSGPGISAGSPPLPSHYESLPDPRSVPVYPDSALGHETVTGAGSAHEYGDLWDIMGNGDADFSATFKAYLEWLPPASFATAGPGRSLLRIHAVDDGGPPDASQIHAVRIPDVLGGDGIARTCSLEIPARRGGQNPAPGIVLRWIGDGPDPSSSLLLDTSPGTPLGHGDAILPPGRSVVDRRSQVCITVTGWNDDESPRWADVVVQVGFPPTNHPPALNFDPSELRVENGHRVELSAVASDPDGDDISIAWDLGDGSPVLHGAVVTAAWQREGEYVVRVEVSDRRGGLASAHRRVRVGNPESYRIEGFVRDPDGRPVAGVRVHNGVTSADGRNRSVVIAWTDSTGAYSLPGLPAGTYPCGAFHPDYTVDPIPPVALRDNSIGRADFVARPIPEVTVSAIPAIAESAGYTELFTISRTGPLDAPLTVLYRLAGTAGPADYARPLVDRLTIPAGRGTATLGLALIDDGVFEGDETIQLTVALPVSAPRVSAQGVPYTVYHPGYDYLEIEGQHYWVLTRPAYVAGTPASAEVILLDDDAPSDHIVSVRADDFVAYEDPLVENAFEFTRTGAVSEPLTVRIEFVGSARNGIDFDHLPSEIGFAPGETSYRLTFRPIADGLEEPEEYAELLIAPDPAYGIERGSARIVLRDRPIFPQDMSIAFRLDGWLQLALRGAPGSQLILEASPDLQVWTPIRTNRLFNSDTAFLILQPPAGPQFYRSVRAP